jgi:hypothetical protein
MGPSDPDGVGFLAGHCAWVRGAVRPGAALPSTRRQDRRSVLVSPL